MNVQSPNTRFNFQITLLALSDIDYQQAIWLEADKSKMTIYVGFHITSENLLNDIIWEESEQLIGFMFRNSEELEVSLKLVQLFEDFLKKMGENLSDKDYINDPDWLFIIAASRHVLRVMNSENK